MAYQGNYVREPEKIQTAGEYDPKYAEGLKYYQNEVMSLQERINEGQLFFDGLSAQTKELDARRTKLLNELEAARKDIDRVSLDAQAIIDEATKVASEQVADILKSAAERGKLADAAAASVHIKRKELDAANDELVARQQEFTGQKLIFATKEKELTELQAVVQDAQTRFDLDQAALVKRSNDISVQRQVLDAREIEIRDAGAVLDSRLRAYQVDADALRLAQADFNVKLAALRDVDAERAKLALDTQKFAENRDRLLVREAALQELESQLNNQRSDLEQREQILVNKFKGVQP